MFRKFNQSLTRIFIIHFNHSMPKRPRCSISSRSYSSNSYQNNSKKVKLSISSNPTSVVKNMHNKIEILNTPVKSANDAKEYKVIRLENGLTACLISEEAFKCVHKEVNYESESGTDSDENDGTGSETSSESEYVVESDDGTEEKCDHSCEEKQKMAAASLCIDVGSFSDPESIQGMAHFLEHMVFMGSEKYPEENDFDKYLKARGGTSNASTDCEMTSFYFECLDKHLRKNLDKFAQFFISPLMKRDTMTKEREVIDSEFQMALQSDTHRKEQLLASLSKASSPVNTFTWGNLITLRDNVSDDILYEAVHEFRKRHYSAHRMTLAIQASLPIDVLESYVIECFSDVPCNHLPADDFKIHGNDVFNTPEFNRIYYVKPVKNTCRLEITWVLPSLLNMYRSKPQHYISWLFGHEGKGSLLSYLQKKFWCLSICTGNSESGMEHNSMYSLFTVYFVLTNKGLNHLYEIIEAMFSYLNFLKQVGPQQRIYEEIKSIEDMSFRYKDEEEPADYVEDIAQFMQLYAPEDYLTGESLYFEYNPYMITEILDKMNPRHMNVLVSSSVLPNGIKYDKTEKWFSTEYTDEELPTQWIERWCSAKPMDCFHLPEDNQFLTRDFSLLNLSDITPSKFPEKILNNDMVELWYKPDTKFRLPIAYFNFYLINPVVNESAFNECVSDLVPQLLVINLTEEIYQAHTARLVYTINRTDFGYVIKVEGYNEKLPLLLKLMVKSFKNLHAETTEEMFKAMKDKLTKTYYNTFLKPKKLARDSRLSLLMKNYWTPLEKYKEISKLTFEEFKTFTENFSKNLHIQALMQGNISKDLALQVTSDVIEILDYVPTRYDLCSLKRVRQIPFGSYCTKMMSFNKNDCNSTITNYYQYQLGDIKSSLILELFMRMLEEPLFDALRTNQQLGYDIQCDLNVTNGMLGYTITVHTQAQKNTSEYVDKRVEEFLKKFADEIKCMKEKKIEQFKQDLLKLKELSDVHMEDEVSKYWEEIEEQEMIFDRRQKEIAVIKELKNSDIVNWIHNFLTNEDTKRKFSFQVNGYVKQQNDNTENCIENVDETENGIDSNEIEDNTQYDIQMMAANGEDPEYYINVTNLEEFRSKLVLLPPHKIIQ